MSRFADVLDALDLALGYAGEVLGESAIGPELALAAGARRGRGYLGGTLVLALAGGTGSGKSSLLNALAGEDIAPVGALRPTTDRPLAWADAAAEPGLAVLLERVGVAGTIPQTRHPGLCIIDLPDQDSVVTAHRATVERLLDEVDAVVWVVDPEKYRDRVLHDDYLAPLAPYYGEQFVFVLNKVDRLGEAVDAVVADMIAALEAGGLTDPDVFALAADPPGGEPMGIEAFRAYLGSRLDAKRAAAGKLLGDVRRAAAAVAAAAEVRHGAGIDFEARWVEARDGAAAGLADGHVEDGLCRIEDFVAAISVEVGEATGSRIRAARLDEVIGTAAASIAGDPGDRATIAAAIDEIVGRRLRRPLWDRAALAAALAGVDVAVAQAEARLSG